MSAPCTLVSEFHEHPTNQPQGLSRVSVRTVGGAPTLSYRSRMSCGHRHPIRLRGCATAGSEGERAVVFSSASLPDGVALKACGSRSELQCPASVLRGRL